MSDGAMAFRGGLSLRAAALTAGAGSVLLLAGAYAFQYWGGLAPCVLCVYQRIPHALVIVLCAGVLALTPRYAATARLLQGGAVIALAISTGLALHHVGVELHWWPGPSTCSAVSGGIPESIEAMRAEQVRARLVRCDAVPWSFLGISLAGYNALFSASLAVAAALPLVRSRRS